MGISYFRNIFNRYIIFFYFYNKMFKIHKIINIFNIIYQDYIFTLIFYLRQIFYYKLNVILY